MPEVWLVMAPPDPGERERDQAIYEAAKVHALHRGADLTEWPNQQALVPDEFRWMRDAINAYEAALAASGMWRVDDEMVERAAEAIAERQEVWPVDLVTRVTARAALVAALNTKEKT